MLKSQKLLCKYERSNLMYKFHWENMILRLITKLKSPFSENKVLEARRKRYWLSAQPTANEHMPNITHALQRKDTEMFFLQMHWLQCSELLSFCSHIYNKPPPHKSKKNPACLFIHAANKKMTTKQTWRGKQKGGAGQACVCDWRSWSVWR